MVLADIKYQRLNGKTEISASAGLSDDSTDLEKKYLKSVLDALEEFGSHGKRETIQLKKIEFEQDV